MWCGPLDLEILEGDCINAQRQGHGYCRGCLSSKKEATSRNTEFVKYVNFIYILFKDAINSHKTALHEIQKIQDKWGNKKHPASKEFWKDLELVAKYTQEAVDAREWLISSDNSAGSSSWVLENLSMCGIIDGVDKGFFNVKAKEFLDARERNSDFDTVIQTPRRAAQMSWLT